MVSSSSWSAALVLCAVVFSVGAPRVSAQRTTVSLDLGWRTLGAPVPACTYPDTIPGIVQTGGWLAPGNVSTAAGCAAAACRANAQAWSFCGGGCGGPSLDPWDAWSRKCVLGNTGQLLSRNTAELNNWTSMARRSGPSVVRHAPMPCPYAAALLLTRPPDIPLFLLPPRLF